MKHLLLSLLLLPLLAGAYTVKTVPKAGAGTFGLVLVQPDKASNVWVIMLPGIGERGNGSDADLQKIAKWKGYAELHAATDHFGFNIVFVQTTGNYESGEVQFAYDFIQAAGGDTRQIHLAGNSLGAFGIARFAHQQPAELSKFATISFFVMGPGTQPNTAKNLAASKRPIWMFSSADDTKDGTSPKVTDDLYAAIKAAGGNVWYTRYLTKAHNAGSAVWGAWHTAKGQVGGWKVANAATATELNNPAVSWFDWFLGNYLTGPINSPLVVGIKLPPATGPLTPGIKLPPATEPLQPVKPGKKVLIELYEDGTWKEK